MNEYDEDNYDYDDYATCESVGMGGNCGNECPVFLRGVCEVQGEAIDDIIKMINNGESKYDEYDEVIQDMIDDCLYDEKEEKQKDLTVNFDKSMEIFN